MIVPIETGDAEDRRASRPPKRSAEHRGRGGDRAEEPRPADRRRGDRKRASSAQRLQPQAGGRRSSRTATSTSSTERGKADEPASNAGRAASPTPRSRTTHDPREAGSRKLRRADVAAGQRRHHQAGRAPAGRQLRRPGRRRDPARRVRRAVPLDPRHHGVHLGALRQPEVRHRHRRRAAARHALRPRRDRRWRTTSPTPPSATRC